MVAKLQGSWRPVSTVARNTQFTVEHRSGNNHSNADVFPTFHVNNVAGRKNWKKLQWKQLSWLLKFSGKTVVTKSGAGHLHGHQRTMGSFHWIGDFVSLAIPCGSFHWIAFSFRVLAVTLILSVYLHLTVLLYQSTFYSSSLGHYVL